MKSINPLLISGARHEFRNTVIWKDSVVFVCAGCFIFLTILLYQLTVLAFFWSYVIAFLTVLVMLVLVVYVLSFFKGHNAYWQRQYMKEMLKHWELLQENN